MSVTFSSGNLCFCPTPCFLGVCSPFCICHSTLLTSTGDTFNSTTIFVSILDVLRSSPQLPAKSFHLPHPPFATCLSLLSSNLHWLFALSIVPLLENKSQEVKNWWVRPPARVKLANPTTRGSLLWGSACLFPLRRRQVGSWWAITRKGPSGPVVGG
jgi:hypothetical protein